MPKPNKYEKATASGFEAAHGKGVSITTVTLGATDVAQNVFGSVNGFNGEITGVLLTTMGVAGATVTFAGTSGTICTIVGSSSTGTVVGINETALANTTFTKTGTLTLLSNSTSDTSQVFITYKVS